MQKKDLFFIAVIGLLIQAYWTTRLAHPSYMDAYYYTTNGQRLAQGHGFTEQVIWQFLDEPTGMPTPSHTYWMPLPSLLAAVGYQFDEHFRAAQLPFWLLAGTLPLLGYLISHQLMGSRWQAWTAALLTAAGGFYAHWLGQPTTFAPFAWFGATCLLTIGMARQSSRAWPWWGVVGLLAGLAHLTRADGLLLLGVALLMMFWHHVQAGKKGTTLIPLLFTLLAGYLLVMGGWLGHSWQVSGRPLSLVGTQTIFLHTYDDLFAYGRSFDLAYFLNWGWSSIIRSRLSGLWVAVQTFVAVNCLIFLTPFVVWAWLKLRQRPQLRPFNLYALLLFATMSLLFTFPGERGGLFHSSMALWPWFMALAAAGLGFAVDWTAAKLPHWQPERAKPIFAALFVMVAFIFSFIIGLSRAPNDEEALLYQEIGTQLPAEAVVMVGNAPGFFYHTRLPALSVPNEPVSQILQAAEQYGATHLILDQNRPLPLRPLYESSERSPQLQLIDTFDKMKLYKIVIRSSDTDDD